MRKGFFTQCVCILLDGDVSLEEIEKCLAPFDAFAPEAQNDQHWAFSGPCLLLPYRPAENGYAIVDIVSCKWPDHMGDAENEKELFSSWSMGFWGPATCPGALERAIRHHGGSDGQLAQSVEKHSAVIRVRLSYAVGADEDEPHSPSDCNPISEMEFLLQVVTALLTLPGALYFFNPNGEVLRDRAAVNEALSLGRENDLPPMDLWSDLRLFKADTEWCVMDSVGNGQLEIPDLEACFTNQYDPVDVATWLRKLTLYLIEKGSVIKVGDTTEGPTGNTWRARVVGESLADPPRSVIRWFPEDGSLAPASLTAAASA